MNVQTMNTLHNDLPRINEHLKCLGFNYQLTSNSLNAILETEPESRFRQALNDSKTNPEAVTYLNDLFVHILPNPDIVQTSTIDEQPVKNNVTELPIQKNREPEREFLSHHVYGGKGSVCINISRTKHGFETISVDAATATGPKTYNWSQKITLQLTQSELPIFLAVILGYLTMAEFTNHNNKNMKVTHQGSNIFFQLWGKDMGSRSVPAQASDTFYIASLVIRQLKKAQPWLESNDISLLLQNVIATMKNNGV